VESVGRPFDSVRRTDVEVRFDGGARLTSLRVSGNRVTRSDLLLRLGPVLVVCVGLALWLGAESIDLSAALNGEGADAFILRSRLTRVALAALVGAALGVSGAALQSLVENPLADPFILGLSGGAAVGATLAIALGLGAL